MRIIRLFQSKKKIVGFIRRILAGVYCIFANPKKFVILSRIFKAHAIYI